MKTEARFGKLLLTALCALLGAGLGAAAGAEELSASPEELVRAFVDAFNARDIDAMLALATDGIEWVSVDGTKVSIETAGKEALRASMTGYLASCTSCRSALEWVSVTGSRAATLERASWSAKDGSTKSQASLSVYEFAEGGKIARVYYFPVEP
jgi:hypothetical protein